MHRGESRKHPARQLTVSVGNLSPILHITVCTFQRRRILACDETHNLILDAWTQAPEWTPVAISKRGAHLAKEFLGSSVEERRQLRR
jgi:hypothetical protein